MRRPYFLATLGLLLQGCISTLSVRVDEPPNNDNVFNLPQVNARLARSEAVINCTDSSSYTAFNVSIDSDSVRFSDLDLGAPHSLATRNVITIEQKDHVRGLFLGLGLGTLTGVGVGVAIVAFSPGSYHGDGLGSPWTIIGTTGLGMIFGLVYGGSIGSTERYQLQVPQDPNPDSVHVPLGAP